MAVRRSFLPLLLLMVRLTDYTAFSDTALLQQTDETAFKILYHRYAKDLYEYAFRLLPLPYKAEDLVQEVFTILFLKKQELLEVKNMKAWLLTVLRRRILNEMRDVLVHQKHHAKAAALKNSSEVLLETYDVKLLQERFNETLLLLTDRCREVFLLSRMEQLSNKEIAKRLNISTQAVEKHIGRATSLIHQQFRNLELTIAILTLPAPLVINYFSC